MNPSCLSSRGAKRRGDPSSALRGLPQSASLLANELMFVIAKEACRLRQSTEIFQMDGHVAALLAMTMLESSSLLSPNGSAFVPALAMTSETTFIASTIQWLGVGSSRDDNQERVHCFDHRMARHYSSSRHGPVALTFSGLGSSRSTCIGWICFSIALGCGVPVISAAAEPNQP